MNTYLTTIDSRARDIDSRLCVALDVRLRDPDEALAHARCVIEQTADFTCAYKLNPAFWLRFDWEEGAGRSTLARLRAMIPAPIPVILDGKYGDAPDTTLIMAQAALALGVDAVTLNPWQPQTGADGFTEYWPLFAYVWCLPSGPPSGLPHVQWPVGPDGAEMPTWMEAVALFAGIYSGSAHRYGVVMGAHHADNIARIREGEPTLPLLIPGVGAQGAVLEEAVEAASGGPFLIVAGRSVVDAEDPRAAAKALRDQIRQADSGVIR